MYFLIGQGLSLLFFAIAFLAARSHYKNRRYKAEKRYATIWPRLFANWSDGLVLWPLNLLAIIVPRLGAPRIATALVMAFASVSCWTYIVALHAKRGATIGKRICRVQVVDAQTGGPIRWRQAVLRELFPALASMGLLCLQLDMLIRGKLRMAGLPADGRAVVHSMTFWYLNAVPVIWFVGEAATALANKRRRALHDWIAGTVVVRTGADIETVAPTRRAGRGARALTTSGV